MKLLSFFTLLFLSHLAFSQVGFDTADYQYLQTEAERMGFHGTMKIVSSGKPVWEYHNGWADPAGKIPNASTVRYPLSSLTKPMLAVLVLQLVEQGKLALHTPIAAYLPKDERLPNDHLITVWHLLSDTSGLGSFSASPAYQPHSSYSVEALYRLVQGAPLGQHRPGITLNTSSSSYLVLARMLELHYGDHIAAILEDRLFNNLKINDFSYSGYAFGMTVDSTGQWTVREPIPACDRNIGEGIFLSMDEYHLFLQAVISETYLSPKSRKLMWSAVARPVHEPAYVQYGLGWSREDPEDLLFVGAHGSTSGYQCAFRYLPQFETYIYTFSNHENGAEGLFMTALKLLIAKNKS